MIHVPSGNNVSTTGVVIIFAAIAGTAVQPAPITVLPVALVLAGLTFAMGGVWMSLATEAPADLEAELPSPAQAEAPGGTSALTSASFRAELPPQLPPTPELPPLRTAEAAR